MNPESKYDIKAGESGMVFEFISEGPKGSISKVILYSPTHLHNFYNLGFGDKDPNSGLLDDMAITNNNDSQKVLRTVASSLYAFTDKFPEALVFAVGSTKARTRLYRMGIGKSIGLISNDFEDLG